MGTLIGEHAKTEGVVLELLKGKEIAIQLQALLENPHQHHQVLPQELSLQILRSFNTTLSDLTSTAGAVDCLERTKVSPPHPGTKTRRGCYKRRRASDSWTVESSTTEDGFAWRKYGQKDILNSHFPRCYYRCTHKYELGCSATKQVQKIKVGKPTLFQIIYINHHTCTETSTDPYNPTNFIHFYPSNSAESKNLISFQTRHDHLHNPNIPPTLNSVKVQDFTTVSEAKSSSQLIVDSVHYPEEWGHQPGLEETGSGLQSRESTSSMQHGMEVDPSGGNDIESFFYFNDI